MTEDNREKSSLAESGFYKKSWKVHPGADFVKIVAEYVYRVKDLSVEAIASSLEWNRGQSSLVDL